MARIPDVTPVIADWFRRAVARGRLRPCSRLPTRHQIARLQRASVNTVQRAMLQLEREGFIVSRGPRGTFISEYPPATCRYGLVLAHYRSSDPRTRIDQFGFLLAREAEKLSNTSRCLVVYEGVSGHVDDPGYVRLEDDLRHFRLAGVICVVPYFFARLPAMAICRRNGLPVVGLPAHGGFRSMMMVRPDADKVLREGLRRLAESGARRVALLMQEADESAIAKACRAVRHAGLETRPHWVLGLPGLARMTARRVVHLMMLGRERPDALFITDDILVEPATLGLVDAGVDVPAELRVLAECNFPYPTRSHVAADRIGFSVTEILRTSLDLIDAARNGKKVPSEVYARIIHETKQSLKAPDRK